MGTSPGLGVSEADSKMRAFAFVLLAAVAINADADADAYTVGQVAHGLTNGGVITGVDYSNGVVSGYGAIGNRPVTHVAGVHPVNTVAGVYSAHPVNTVAGVYNAHPINTVAGVYNTHHAVATPAAHTVPAVRAGVYSTHAVPSVYSGLNTVPSVYSRFGSVYGKREAEAEPEADPLLYTNNLVHHAGVYNSYPVSTVAGVYNTHAVPAVRAGVYSTHVPSVYSNVYSGLNTVPSVYSRFGGVYGKREAEAEPEADPLLYTNNLVHHAGVYNVGVSHVAGVYNT